MLLIRPLLKILLLVGTTVATFAQSSPKYTYTVGGGVYEGFVIAESPAVARFAPIRPVGFELFVNKNTYGHTYWEDRYGRPDIGLALTYTDYRDTIVGHSLGLTAYMDIPIVQLPRSRITFGLGLGLGYHTQPYQPPIETGNVMLGTPLTLAMRTQFRYTYRLSSHWRATLSAKLMHYSNAAYTKPNRGVNMPQWQVSVSRVINQEISDYATSSEVPEPEPYQRVSYYLGVSGGVKTLETGADQHQFINLHLYTHWRLSPLSSLNGGLDVFFDEATYHHIRQQLSDNYPDYRRVGMVVGHELFYDRLSLLTQVGVYLYRPFQQIYKPVYQRLGLRYALTDHLVSGMMLKLHGARAEYLELGLGVRF